MNVGGSLAGPCLTIRMWLQLKTSLAATPSSQLIAEAEEFVANGQYGSLLTLLLKYVDLIFRETESPNTGCCINIICHLVPRVEPASASMAAACELTDALSQSPELRGPEKLQVRPYHQLVLHWHPSHPLCNIVVGGRHFWLFVLAGGPPFILFTFISTYIRHHLYTLCIYTCLADPRQCKKTRLPITVLYKSLVYFVNGCLGWTCICQILL